MGADNQLVGDHTAVTWSVTPWRIDKHANQQQVSRSWEVEPGFLDIGMTKIYEQNVSDHTCHNLEKDSTSKVDMTDEDTT